MPVAHVGGWPAFRCVSGASVGRLVPACVALRPLRRARALGHRAEPGPAPVPQRAPARWRRGRPARRRGRGGAGSPPTTRRAVDLLAARGRQRGRTARRATSPPRYVDDVGAVGPRRAVGRPPSTSRGGSTASTRPRRTRRCCSASRSATATGSAITSFGGGDRRSPLWLTGPLEVRRSADTLVVATTCGRAAWYAGRAEAAVPVVRAVLPQWRRELVVEVPGAAEALDAALGADPGSYADIAAVTASVDGTVTPDAAGARLRQPGRLRRLEPAGAQVVMSHEATHVATDAPLTSGMPLWLLEGFADYVALRDVDLPITTTAGQIIKQVRRDGAPDHLPGQAEFDRPTTHLGAAYESAWLACLVLADRGRRGRAGRASTRRVCDGAEPGRRRCASRSASPRHGRPRAWQQRLTTWPGDARPGPHAWRSGDLAGRARRGASAFVVRARCCAGPVGPGPRRAAAPPSAVARCSPPRRSQRAEDYAR